MTWYSRATPGRGRETRSAEESYLQNQEKFLKESRGDGNQFRGIE